MQRNRREKDIAYMYKKGTLYILTQKMKKPSAPHIEIITPNKKSKYIVGVILS